MDRWWDKPLDTDIKGPLPLLYKQDTHWQRRKYIAFLYCDITSLCGCFSSFGNRGGQSDMRARPMPPVPCLWPPFWPRHCTCVHLFHIGPVQLISFAESVKPPVIIGSYKSPSTGKLTGGHKPWCFLSSHQSPPVTSSKYFSLNSKYLFLCKPRHRFIHLLIHRFIHILLPSSSSHNYDAIGPAVTSNCNQLGIGSPSVRWKQCTSNSRRSDPRKKKMYDFIKREMTSAWYI